MSIVVIGAAVCHTKPVRTTEPRRPDLQTERYESYVARCTQELEQMGGPFKGHAVAEAKARKEATDRLGEESPTYSTSWIWGKGAKDPAAQANLEDKLDKMDRDQKR